MIGLIVGVIVLALVLCVSTLVQLLYSESLRVRARELCMLEFFRSTLEHKLGIRDEQGALAFSIVKHTALIVMAQLIVAARLDQRTPLWQILLHVVNHATHHRGQVSGFLRAMGHTPPPLDLIAFYRTL